MPSHHEPLEAMGAIDWDDVPQDNINEFVADVFSDTQTVVESIPAPPAAASASQTSSGSIGRARSKTESAASAGDVQLAVSQRQTATSIAHAQDLRKEWKEAKVNPRDNPLGINVYKLAAKDGRGAWFARRSVHEGLSYDSWRKGLEIEFPETMKVQGSPGSGNIRGIGADKRVEHTALGDAGQLQVFQLSAQFPGPTAPRDFVTLLLTSETSVAPAGSSRPLRQFMIVSKPCVHPECPPRQGIIRGHYESVEVIREVPTDNALAKRSQSSADLTKDDGRSRISFAGGSEGHSPEDDAPVAVEWLMVTRSDPGGSVPRFLIEKGTPPGIVGDAGKFLKWVTSQAAMGFTKPAPADPEAAGDDPSQLEKTKSLDLPPLPPRTRAPGGQRESHAQDDDDDDDTVPSSNGLYGIIAGAIGAAGSLASGILGQFSSFSETGSNESSFTSDTTPAAVAEEDESDLSDTSSLRSFASALERSLTQEKSPESLLESNSETSKSNTTQPTQQDKELKKLQERRRKLDEKVAKLQERHHSRLQGDKDKDAAASAKLREKHDREVAKQEEKYRREMRKLEERREQEARKAEEKRRKATEREERNNLRLELDKARAERDLARKQLEIAEAQVGELQAQNTMLVRKLGKMGALGRADSVTSFKSLQGGTGAEAAVSSTSAAVAATSGV